MSEQHPISLPDELCKEFLSSGKTFFEQLKEAARWGADQELEACCAFHKDLRNHRRPKPSLKEQALSEVAAAVAGGNITPERGAIIRLALEALSNDCLPHL